MGWIPQEFHRYFEWTEAMTLKAEKEGRNTELKAYAAKLLPSLQEHRQLARDLAAKYQ